MSTHLKIHGGTPLASAPSLCDSCRHSQITRGHAIDEEIIFCGAGHLHTVRITFKVTTCSNYQDHGVPTYWELMQQAWILQPGSRKKPAGFVRAADLPEAEMARIMAEREDPLSRAFHVQIATT